MNRRVLALLILGISLSAILAVASALGAGGLSYPVKHRSVSNAEPGRTAAFAQCPQAKPHPTGGGVEVDGDESGLDLEVGSTLPTRHHDGWNGGGNNSTSSDAQMTVTAICGKGAYVYRTAKKRVPVDGARGTKVSCPAGTDVVGGGVGAPGDHGVEVGASEPSDGGDRDSKADDAWLGRESNTGSKRTLMKVTAVCSKRGAFTYVKGSATSVIDNTQASASVSCPASTQVTGGGVDIKGRSTDLEVADTFPIDDGDPGSTPDNGWEGNANNDSSGANTSMRAFAICQG